MNPQTLLIIAKELRHEADTYVVSPVIKKRLSGWAARLEAENAVLQKALWDQWEQNHSEHCTNEWPHNGTCYYSLIPELQSK